MSNNFNDPFAANLIGLWDFLNGSSSSDTGLADGIAQNGHFAGNATTQGEALKLDGHGDHFDVVGDYGGTAESQFDLDEGTISVQFNQTEHVGWSHDTLVNRGEYDDKHSEGWFAIQVSSSEEVKVLHYVDGQQVFLKTSTHFFDQGDDVKATYSWDATTGVTFKVENLTTGETELLTDDKTGINMDIGDNDDEIFTFGAREAGDGHYDQYFKGTIDYVAVYDKDILAEVLPDGNVDGENFGETMVLGYDDGNAPTDQGGDMITTGDDTIFGNGGDDTIDGDAGDDTIYGDFGDDAETGTFEGPRESFNWDLILSDSQADTTVTQDTGDVNVTYTRTQDTGQHESKIDNHTHLNVSGIDSGSEVLDTNSSLYSETKGQGNTGEFQWAFSEPVGNVDFNINDIDGDAVVTVMAFDADGNQIPVSLTGGSELALLDTDSVAGADTADATGLYRAPSENQHNLQVEIAGPVSRIVVEHTQNGSDNSGIHITDMYFDTGFVPGGGNSGDGGDDVITGGAGADMMFGEGGDDTFIVDDAADGAGDVVVGGNGPDDTADNDVLDLRGAGPVTIVSTTDGTDDGATTGTVTFADGSTLAFSQIEEILTDPTADGVVDGLDVGEDMGPGYTDAQGDQIDGADGDNDSILGNGGDDTIDAGDGNDDVDGGEGSDTITGGDGNDTVAGGDDADVLSGGDGDDTLLGGEGDDDIAVNDGDEADGGTGDDVFTLDTSDPATDIDNITIDGGSDGTDGNPDGPENGDEGDVLDLSALDDDLEVTFETDPEDGTVDGLDADAANDIVFEEIEKVITGSGDDEVDASASDGPIDVETGAGDDTIDGSSGDDMIDAGADDDVVDGGEGDDTIDGGDGADSLIGGDGDDTLLGGDGDDDIAVNDGDTAEGGDGDDVFTLDTTDPATDIDGIMIDGGSDGTDGAPAGPENGDEGDVLDLGDLTDDLQVTFEPDPESGAVDGLDSDGADDLEFDEIEKVITGSGDDVIDGGDATGPIDVETGAGDDTIEGGSGDDMIDAGDDDDSVDGGAGEDIIDAGEGDDIVDAGADDDTIIGGGGNDTIDGGTGTDTYDAADGETIEVVVDDFGDGAIEKLVGGTTDTVTSVENFIAPEDAAEADVITLTTPVFASDVPTAITGLSDDAEGTFTAPNGTMITFGPSETYKLSDLLDGTAPNGTDPAVGPEGDYSITDGDEGGQVGNISFDNFETINFTVDFDEDDPTSGPVDGLDTGEVMTPGYMDAQGDEIDGLDGDDDVIFGNGGDDTIDSGEGDDKVDGGSGDDTFVISDTGNGIDSDTITGGEDGETDGDKLDLSDIDDDLQVVAVSDDPEAGVITDGNDVTIYEEVEIIETGSGDDSIIGSDGDDSFISNEGEDEIDTGAGDDVVDAGDDNDTVTTGDGSDTVDGGDGDDVIDTRGDIVTDPISGIEISGSPDLGFPPVPGDSDPDDDKDSVSGGAGNDTITTGDDADTIDGGAGADTIDGGFDADVIDGGDDDDRIVGGEGSDLIEGGEGDDTIFGGLDPDLGLPDNLDIADDGSDLPVPDPVTDNGLDTIFGGAGNDTIFGADDDDYIEGGEDNDVIDGGKDDDTILGDEGDDTITGGQGNDDLFGGDDRDTFLGGNGGDTVDGGSGGDDFDTLDLTGSDVDFITYTSPDQEDGTVTFLDGSTMTFEEIENVIPCFTPGTLIATPRGEKLVEELREGDRIITRDNGIQEIRWVGQKQMKGTDLVKNPNLKPVLIKAGSLGNGLPERDMLVSPNHRMLVANDKTQLYFEEREVLAAAKHLVGTEGIHSVDVMNTTYIHFMFDNHEVVLSNGAWTESFQPGDFSLKGLGGEQQEEIFALFPELKDRPGREAYTSARKALKKHEARLLAK